MSELAEYIEANSMPEPNSGCYLWLGRTNPEGYGHISYRRWDGIQLAHRAAWFVRHGSLPKDLCVCHKCDVRSCVNADHFFIGTRADNAADRDAKGRRTPHVGEDHGRAKLKEEDIHRIRIDQRILREISEEFGVSRQVIWKIQKNLAWRHVPCR